VRAHAAMKTRQGRARMLPQRLTEGGALDDVGTQEEPGMSHLSLQQRPRPCTESLPRWACIALVILGTPPSSQLCGGKRGGWVGGAGEGEKDEEGFACACARSG